MSGHLLLSALAAAGADQTYPAIVRSVTDGDTFHADVVLGTIVIADLTADVVLRDMRVRLAGCNAAELRTEAGRAAAANLRTILPPGIAVTLHDVEAYKYGFELVAAVTLPTGQDLVDMLVSQQWLTRWVGRGPRPTPPWPRTVP